MTPKQVSEYLQIPISTFYKLSARGALAGVVRIGGALRCDRCKLEKSLDRNSRDTDTKGGKP